MSSISVKNLKSVPWFLAYGNFQSASSADVGFIISRTVPDIVNDTKDISFSETQVPGGKSTMIKFGSFGTRKISFEIKMADFNNNVGITSVTSSMAALRMAAGFGNAAKGLAGKTTTFVPPPQVVYYHTAATNLPIACWCSKIDFRTSYPNRIGKPQVVEASIELLVDESNYLYALETAAQKVQQLLAISKTLKQSFGTGHPYKKETL